MLLPLSHITKENMDNFRLNEAFEYAKKVDGRKIKKIDLAKILWGDSTAKTAHTNFSNLANGKSKKINIDAIPIICKHLGVTADFLFGLSQEPTKAQEFQTLKAQILEYLEKSDELNELMRETVN